MTHQQFQHSLSRTDTPSDQHYYSGEISRVTGFSLRQTVRLELLSAHPESVCDHTVWGPAWQRAEVDDFAAFLAQNPEYRDLLLLLIGDMPAALPAGPGVAGAV